MWIEEATQAHTQALVGAGGQKSWHQAIKSHGQGDSGWDQSEFSKKAEAHSSL